MTQTLKQSSALPARDERLDRARIFLIWLVVFGHLIELYLDAHPIFESVYIYIYSLHMPAFVMLAGMTSRAGLTQKSWESITRKIVVPLLIFTALYEFFHFYVTGYISNYFINGAPYWILWFLMSLLLWKLSLPYWLKLRHPIIISSLLAVLIGLIDAVGITLSLSRTFYFLPFFLVGHELYKGRLVISFDAVMDKIGATGAMIWLLSLAPILYLLSPYITPKALYGVKPYSALGQGVGQMMALRVALLTLALLSALALIRLCASLPKLPAIRAENTLWVYLWHGFFIVLAEHLISKWVLNAQIDAPFAFIALAICAALAWVMCFILSCASLAQHSEKLMRIMSPRKAPASSR